nr:hypothetical protein [Flavobacteriales bacterium]
IPQLGCIYAESFGAFHESFDGAACSNYGGTPCEGGSSDVEGCLDANATNYNAVATVQAHDQWGNQLCTYASCDDVPSDGCMYANAFAGWNDYFGPSDCSGYGGTPCEGTTNVTSGCTDPMALNYNANATVDNGTCDYPCSPDWSLTITDQNHSIFISGLWTDVNGAPLADGSLLGVFYEDAYGNLVCAGYTEIAEGTVQIAAMGDDVSTEEIDGLLPDQELEYHVWDASTCEEFSADITYSGGPEVYTTNGITFISSVVAAPFGPAEQHLNFVSGWSIFSTYMIPNDLDIASILAPIVDNLVIAKDYSGLAYLPAWDYNGIGAIEVGQAYQIKTSLASELTIAGAYAFPEENPIEFGAGWNMIGYLRAEAALADLVLADLVDQDNLVIAKNSLGSAYLPDWNFNGIGEMLPGEGYQIKTNTPGTLHYLSNDAYYRISSLEVTENNISHFAKVPATDNNMTVVLEDAAWDVLPTEGSEIAAFDDAGNMIGSAIYSSPVTAIAVWGDDATTSSKDGLEASEAVSFKVWASDKVLDFTVKEWTEGSSSYNVDAINVASSIETNHVIADLNSTERVLVKVINVLGQEVILNNDSFNGKVLFHIYNDGTVEKVVK